jgi:hypothetical protein
MKIHGAKNPKSGFWVSCVKMERKTFEDFLPSFFSPCSPAQGEISAGTSSSCFFDNNQVC